MALKRHLKGEFAVEYQTWLLLPVIFLIQFVIYGGKFFWSSVLVFQKRKRKSLFCVYFLLETWKGVFSHPSHVTTAKVWCMCKVVILIMLFQLSSLLTLKLNKLSRVCVSVQLKIKPAIPFLSKLALDLLT